MNQKITLYHGSEQIVESPTFGLGKQNNDFGLGFYCTESEELAKEWAVSSLRNGFVNRYSLDTEYLKILNLNSPDYRKQHTPTRWHTKGWSYLGYVYAAP